MKRAGPKYDPLAAPCRVFRLAAVFGSGVGVRLAAALLLICFIGGGCTGESIDPDRLGKSFKEIHRRIYDIYQLKEGGAVYDVLAESCTGRELEREVFEYLKCLRVQKELDTYVSIVDVIYNDVRVRTFDSERAEIFCKWIVIGKVRHPTHIHRKVNLNEAIYQVALRGGAMRITGYDLLTNQAVEVTRP